MTRKYHFKESGLSVLNSPKPKVRLPHRQPQPERTQAPESSFEATERILQCEGKRYGLWHWPCCSLSGCVRMTNLISWALAYLL